jgi:outer membrane protein TolC
MAPGMDMDDYPPRPIPLERRTAVIEQWRALVREREAEMAEAAATSETEAMSALAHLEECAATQVLLQRQAGNLGHAAELARSGFIAGTVPLSGVLQARRAVLDLQRAQAVTARDAFVTSGSLIDLDPADPVGADGGAKP